MEPGRRIGPSLPDHMLRDRNDGHIRSQISMGDGITSSSLNVKKFLNQFLNIRRMPQDAAAASKNRQTDDDTIPKRDNAKTRRLANRERQREQAKASMSDLPPRTTSEIDTKRVEQEVKDKKRAEQDAKIQALNHALAVERKRRREENRAAGIARGNASERSSYLH